MTQPARIAYFIAGGIGDGVMAYPALVVLKKRFPQAHIDVFVPPPKLHILAVVLHDFHPRELTAGETIRLLLGAFSQRFDMSFTNTIACFRIGIEIISALCSKLACGFRYPDELAEHRLYGMCLPVSENEHDIDQNLQLVSKGCGVEVSEGDRSFPPWPNRRDRVAEPTVLIHPGAEKGYESKLWPVEKYTELIDRLVRGACAVTVLVGPADEAVRPYFQGSDRIRILESPDPETLINELRGAALFIGNDSGPAHLAALLGVPGITLIGPVSPVRSAPRGCKSTVIYNAQQCSPCHFSSVSCNDNRCMKSITVDQVWATVEQRLSVLRCASS